MKNIIDLTDKTIIVTGAASGIGRETAIVASKIGAKVILVDVADEGLKTTMCQLEGHGHSYYVLNLCEIGSIATKLQEIATKYEHVDGLVHCAGISSRKPINVLSKDGFANIMDVNFYSFVELVKQSTKKRWLVDGGSIVVMSSISSIRGYKAKTEYCVSKAAVDAFVRCAAAELASRKIRVNSVMAAEVLTPLAQKARETNAAIGVVDFIAPLGPSDPYEVANTIAFLLSDATKTITGTCLRIDGGATIQ